MNDSLGEFLTSLARNSAAAAVLVILVLLVQRLFPRQLSPQWRSALWLLVVVRLLPFAPSSPVSVFNLLPPWSGEAHAARSAPSLAAAPAGSIASPFDPAPIVGPTGPAATLTDAATSGSVDVSPTDEGHGGSVVSWQAALFLTWLSGVIGLAVYVITVATSLRRLLRRAEPLREGDVLALLEECCDRMGVRRVPVVAESDAVQTPALHGVFRPQLLLPAGFTKTFSADELRFVFLHELAHLRRHDLLLNWIMTSLQIMHWFNPLVWFGFARWRVDREIACDAAALEATGASNNRAYGQTMLRLLQQLSPAGRRPGLVGILEDRRQLQRRMKMIAHFAPARRSFVAAGLLAILAMVGLTDAQVMPQPAPSIAEAAPLTAIPISPPATVASPPAVPAGPSVLILVSRAETMLGDTEEEIARWRTQPDNQKTSAPKWQRAAQTTESLLRALVPGTQYQVVLCGQTNLLALGSGIRAAAQNDVALDGIVQRLRTTPPADGFDLELAFASVSISSPEFTPERVVLITDALSTAADRGDQIRKFEAAAKALKPRIPIHTVLLPLVPSEPATVGLYWGLANATRGALTTVSSTTFAPRTHIAFIIDTSGSMRDPNTGGLWPIVIKKVEETLDAHPNLVGLQLLDGDGRFILPRRGTGSAGWNADTPETRERMKNALRSYNQDTVSNPVPGVYNALRFLDDKGATDMRIGLYLFGDEFNSRDPAAVAIQRLDQLNPRAADGQRRIVINAIGFPTTIRYQFSMGNTGLRFADLMRTITHEHGGTFMALQEL